MVTNFLNCTAFLFYMLPLILWGPQNFERTASELQQFSFDLFSQTQVHKGVAFRNLDVVLMQTQSHSCLFPIPKFSNSRPHSIYSFDLSLWYCYQLMPFTCFVNIDISYLLDHELNEKGIYCVCRVATEILTTANAFH